MGQLTKTKTLLVRLKLLQLVNYNLNCDYTKTITKSGPYFQTKATQVCTMYIHVATYVHVLVRECKCGNLSEQTFK